MGSPRHDREHVSFLAGIRILQTGRNTDKYSGYQVMRLATELMPAYAAILGKNGLAHWLHIGSQFLRERGSNSVGEKNFPLLFFEIRSNDHLGNNL